MKSTEIAALVQRLAPSLRALDELLADTRPGGPGCGAADGDAAASLGSLCRDLHAAVEAAAQALREIGEGAAAPSTDASDAARPCPVAAATRRLASVYRQIARASLAAGRPPLHERLADCARDNVVTAAHLLTDVIGQSVALLRQVAASGAGGDAAFDASFDAPADADELAAFTPRRLGYAAPAAKAALRAAAECPGVAAQALVTLQRLDHEAAAPQRPLLEPQPKKKRSFWAGLAAFWLALLIGDALIDDCDCDSGSA